MVKWNNLAFIVAKNSNIIWQIIIIVLSIEVLARAIDGLIGVQRNIDETEQLIAQNATDIVNKTLESAPPVTEASTVSNTTSLNETSSLEEDLMIYQEQRTREISLIICGAAVGAIDLIGILGSVKEHIPISLVFVALMAIFSGVEFALPARTSVWYIAVQLIGAILGLVFVYFIVRRRRTQQMPNVHYIPAPNGTTETKEEPELLSDRHA